MLGAEGEAWSIVRTALSLERVGIPRFALASRMLDRVVASLKRADRFAADACVQAARARAACEVARLYSYQIVDQRRHGTPTGPEASAARVATVSCERLVAEFVVEHQSGRAGWRRSHASGASSARHRGRHRLGRRRDSAQSRRDRAAWIAEGAALMDLRLTADQTALLTAINGLAAQFQEKPIEFHGFALVSEELEQQLAAAEFFDIAATPGLGPVGAAMAVERLARLPYAAEVALSMLVRPHVLGGAWPRPFALVEHGRPGRFVATRQDPPHRGGGHARRRACTPRCGARPSSRSTPTRWRS